MQANFYVISLSPDRLVATEIRSDEAAVALDEGQTVLLLRPADLVRVAMLHRRSLTVPGREQLGACEGTRTAEEAADGVRRAARTPGGLRERSSRHAPYLLPSEATQTVRRFMSPEVPVRGCASPALEISESSVKL